MILLLDGLKLLIIGMGTVTFFLCVMIVFILLSAKLSEKFEHLLPEPVVAPPPSPARKAAASQPALTDNGTLVAVISAAIQMHRRQRQQQS